MKTKLSAFTLMEVTIAMVLAAISIGISFSVYRLLSKAYRDYDEKNRISAEFVHLEQLLNKDILKADRIIKTEEGIVAADTSGNIEYTFTTDYILRNQYELRTDTFFIAHKNILTSFEGESAETGELIDEVSVVMEFSGKDIPVTYVKRYSAEELMEDEVH